MQHVYTAYIANMEALQNHFAELLEEFEERIGRLPESPSPLRGERDDVGRVATRREKPTRHDESACPYCGERDAGLLCDDDHCREER